MRFLILLLCACTQLACHQPGHYIRTYNLDGYTLNDTILTGKENSIPFDGNATYAICYLGPASGKIAIGKPIQPHGKPENITGYIPRKFDSSFMTIQVDTAATQIQVECTHFDTTSQQCIIDSVALYTAMRVTLRNTSDSLLFLGRFNTLQYMWLEIQNGKNDWVRIENPSVWYAYCATGARENILKPGEILIAKFPRYEGEYIANYRLVWQKKGQGRIFSNEFVAPVNPLMLNIVDLTSDRNQD